MISGTSSRQDLPLTSRDPEDILAYVLGQEIRVEQFVCQARSLSGGLPRRRHAINLCQDRYAFALGFFGAILAGHTNLLPPNHLRATVEDLLVRYPEAYVISDQDGPDRWPASADPRPAMIAAGPLGEIPWIAPDHLACIVFTSGSTGPSKPIEKPWRTLVESSRINARELGLDTGHHNLVATVPAQHMYGLETSILLPLFAPVAVSSEHPFLPHEVSEALSRVPAPRVLVSTPVHIRAICGQGCSLPSITRVISATAPLDRNLADQLESRHDTRVLEIYGCSETGCLARRDPVRAPAWQPFQEFRIRRSGEQILASADHLPREFRLHDRMKFRSDGRFDLIGRSEDLVNIAGKRASLSDLNRRLLSLPGVHDGAIFEPQGPVNGKVRRLAAVVVAPGLSVGEIRSHLRTEVDTAFIPRPIRKVSSLPRSPTGKLTRQDLVRLLNTEGKEKATEPVEERA